MPPRRTDLNDPLRVLLIGCGVMGTRHARVVAADPRCALLTYDVHPERAAAVAAATGGRAVPQIPAEIDLAIVATPTPTHRAIALPLLARGAWCLVEKPLAGDLLGATALASHPRCGCGLSERHNRAVRAAGPLRPQVIDARRRTAPTGRGLDTDVVLDLMVHDLDLVLSWTGADVVSIEADGDRDQARAALVLSDGTHASLEVSRVAAAAERVVRVREASGVVELDLLAGLAWRDGRALPCDPRDALTVQWERFTGAVRDGTPLDSGLPALAAAAAVRARLG